jgi:hypothetical protein
MGDEFMSGAAEKRTGAEATLAGGEALSAGAVSGQRSRRWAQRVQRLGAAGFLFFLIKGLLWLTVPALLAYLGYG